MENIQVKLILQLGLSMFIVVNICMFIVVAYLETELNTSHCTKT